MSTTTFLVTQLEIAVPVAPVAQVEFDDLWLGVHESPWSTPSRAHWQTVPECGWLDSTGAL